MRQRLVLMIVGVATVAASATLVLVAGQAPAAGGRKAGPAPKTSWSEPDLQGIWTRDYDTALQRSAKYAGKESFSDAEIAELDRIRASRPGKETRSVRGTEQDVAGAYNAVFNSQRPTGRQTSLIVDPPDGRIPPVTPAVQKRRAEIRAFRLALMEATDTCKDKMPGCEGGKYTGVASPRRLEPPPYYLVGRVNRSDGPEDRGLSERCMTAILPDLLGGNGGFLGIVHSPKAVSIFYDTGQGQGWHRVIPVDGSPHLPPSVRQWWGDSRGRWEGNTLVVDVTNFSSQTEFQDSRENLHLIERWTRLNPNTLEYVVTMDDPTTWTKPWTVKMELTKQPSEPNRIYKEPRCHEGNYGMIALLAGMRAQELAFAEGRGVNPATTNVDTPTGSANTLAEQAGEEETDPFAN